MTTAESLLAELFAAQTAEQEKLRAQTLSEHLRSKRTKHSLTFRAPNGIDRLTSQEYVHQPDAVALICIDDDCYAWRPVDKVNTDMFFLE